MGRSRLLKVVPFKNLGTVYYSYSIVTMALSYIISEITQDDDWKLRFFHTPCIWSLP